MPRKIFWGLWMTVWPAVALIPPLVTAQAPQPAVTAVSSGPVITPARQAATPVTVVSPQTELAQEEPSDAPQFAPPLPELAEPPLTKSSNTTHRVSLPSSEPEEKAFDSEEFEASEQLPSIGSPPVVRSPRTTVRTGVPLGRTGPTLNAQEERAHKLIQERAMLQANERRARLAAKQWHKTVPRQPGKSASWQPQLTQPNWLAERGAAK
ncbi:MAG: hypothetical protein V4719_12250 [Planctomycetota bacterium]